MLPYFWFHLRERERIFGKEHKDVRGWGRRLVAIVFFYLWQLSGILTISLCFEILLYHMGIMMALGREHSVGACNCITGNGGGLGYEDNVCLCTRILGGNLCLVTMHSRRGFARAWEWGRRRRITAGTKPGRGLRLVIEEWEGGLAMAVLWGSGMADHLCLVPILLVGLVAKGKSGRLGPWPEGS